MTFKPTSPLVLRQLQEIQGQLTEDVRDVLAFLSLPVEKMEEHLDFTPDLIARLKLDVEAVEKLKRQAESKIDD